MNEIFKKFNVFDYFSHLVPGTIVVLALLHYFQCKDASMSNLFGCLYDKLVEYNSIAFWTFFLVASHCIGLVNNVISDFVWYGFRNNAWFISASENMVRDNPKPFCNVIYLLLPIIFYIIHVILSSSNCSCCKTCAEYLPHIAVIIFVIFVILTVALIIYIFNSHDEEKLEDYYKKYEEVKVHYPSNNISNLEAQIAFLRNSIIPLVLLSLICIDKSNPSILLIVSPFIAFVAFFLHQQKLYFHVYELCHIIDLNKGQEKKSPEIRIIINKTNNIHE